MAAEISFVVSSDQSCHSSHGLRWLEWLNFFLADIQTGVGPFLAAYLATTGWNPGPVGLALTFGGLVTVALQTPAGAVIDSVHRKRALLAWMIAALKELEKHPAKTPQKANP